MEGQVSQGENKNEYDGREIQRNKTTGNKPKNKKEKLKPPKKKVSFGGVLLRIFFGLLFTIIGIAGTIYGVLYFKFNVNVINLIGQVNTLNQAVSADTLYKNKFTESDLTSFNNKFNSQYLENDAFLFSDKEIGAFISEELKNSVPIDTGAFNIVTECNMQLIQIDFYNTFDKSNSNHLTDMNVVIKLDMRKVKSENMESFLFSLISDKVPDDIYVSSDFEIIVADNENGYELKPKSITVNNLNEKDTAEFFNAINIVIKMGTAEEFSMSIGEPFASAMLDSNENSLFSSLKDAGAKSYSYLTENEIDYFIVYKHELTETANITYNNTKDAENNNLTSYGVLDNKITLSEITETGYEFLGWFDGEGDDASKIETISAWGLKDYNLFAKWKLIEYKITYDMRGSIVDGENPTTYTIESEISLLTPYKVVEAEFKGWTFKYSDTKELVSGYDNPDLGKKIKKGTYGDLTIYARFDDERILDLYADGKYQSNMTIIIGETFSANDIIDNFHPSNLGMSGYSVAKWYVDSELTTEYDYSTIVRDDMILYGEWEYIVDRLKFYPYMQEFNLAVNSQNKVLTIESYEKLEAYFEYILFYNIQDTMDLTLSYLNPEAYAGDEVDKLVNYIEHNQTLSVGAQIYTNSNKNKLSFKITTNCDSYATLIMDEHKIQANEQQANVLKLDYEKVREDNYDNFNINKVSKTLEVSTSLQLVYALENGYRPICKADSMAEKVYNEAKNVLRNICDDSMNDETKLRAMYEWLALSVSYDQKALTQSSYMSASECKKYRSWFAEGVFFDKIAVCEGYAKAFIIMARIEGIPMVMVTGNDHAWNKVYVNDAWYGIDATHADLSIGDEIEVMTYRQFLFTDAYKESLNYKTNDFKEFSATTKYNYFDNTSFVVGENEFDAHIDSFEELELMLLYIDNILETENYNDFTFEISVDPALSFSAVNFKINYVFTGKSVSYSNYNNNYGSMSYIFIIESA